MKRRNKKKGININPSLISNLWADESEITRKKEIATKFEEEMDYIEMYFHSYIRPKRIEELYPPSFNSCKVPERVSSIAGSVARSTIREENDWNDSESVNSYKSFIPDENLTYLTANNGRIKPKYKEMLSTASYNSLKVPERGSSMGAGTTRSIISRGLHARGSDDTASFQSYKSFGPGESSDLIARDVDYDEENNESFLDSLIEDYSEKLLTHISLNQNISSPECSRGNFSEPSRVKTPTFTQARPAEMKISAQTIEQEDRIQMTANRPADIFDSAVDKFDLKFPREPSNIINKYE